MLFDLQGKRKNVVRVVYVVLAAMFVIGFLGAGVGVGGGGGGGFFDLLGGGGSSDSVLQSQIDDAQKKVDQATKTKDKQALRKAQLELARANFTLSTSNEGIDTEKQFYNEKGQQAAAGGLEAWEKYLKLHPKNPDPGVAQLAANTYQFLGDAEGALKAQQIVVDSNPRAAVAWGNLALFAYATGDNALGDKAQAKSLSLVPKDQRNTVKSSLDKEEKAGKKFHKQVEEQKKAQKKQGKGTTGSQGTEFGPLPGQNGGLSAPGGSALGQ